MATPHAMGGMMTLVATPPTWWSTVNCCARGLHGFSFFQRHADWPGGADPGHVYMLAVRFYAEDG
ncbi:hypothetical protein A7K92_27170 [Klebsiella pneumoniae]|nr:hypothetical protein A7K92_27170 [Klebsiella pneumoniae]